MRNYLRGSGGAFLLILMFFCMAGIAHAAILSGTVYNESLSPLNDVVVVVNSDPVQRYVVKESTYTFELPPGNYRLSARTFDDENSILGADENFVINKEGHYIFDLVLSPVNETQAEDGIFGLPARDFYRLTDGAVALIILLVIAIFFFRVYRKKKGIVIAEEKPEDDDGLDATTREVLQIIQGEKRITQKDIRKNFDLSEAKISLIITELESKGKIKRIKQGRGNVIVYTGK